MTTPLPQWIAAVEEAERDRPSTLARFMELEGWPPRSFVAPCDCIAYQATGRKADQTRRGRLHGQTTARRGRISLSAAIARRRQILGRSGGRSAQGGLCRIQRSAFEAHCARRGESRQRRLRKLCSMTKISKWYNSLNLKEVSLGISVHIVRGINPNPEPSPCCPQSKLEVALRQLPQSQNRRRDLCAARTTGR